MNKVLLKEVAEYILKYPEKYNQETCCGTVCCIAGNALRLGQPSIFRALESHYLSHFSTVCKYNWERDSRAVLGLTTGQFDRLCRSHYHGWPIKFFRAYVKGEQLEDTKLMAKAGYDRIMYFIKTGK